MEGHEESDLDRWAQLSMKMKGSFFFKILISFAVNGVG